MRKCVPQLTCRRLLGHPRAIVPGLLVCGLLIPLGASPALAERLDLGVQPFAETAFDLETLEAFPADLPGGDQADQTALGSTVAEPGTPEGTTVAQHSPPLPVDPATTEQAARTSTVAEPGSPEGSTVAQNGMEPAAGEVTGGTDVALTTDPQDGEPAEETDPQETDLAEELEPPDQEMVAFGDLPEPQSPQLLWRFKTLFVRNDEAADPQEAVEELQEQLSHIPLIRSPRVERHIQYFRTSKRDHFDQWLVRLNHYKPLVEKIFAQFQLPTDLIFLSLVESGFNPKAYSRARAAGPWQFMKATGRHYGLRVDHYVDERRDPIKSTVAAARYLRDLYDLFGTWPLAMAAYNAGERKIQRALRKAKAETFWEIAQTRYIRRETREYVPRFMAAAIIARNPDQYGFEAVPDEIHEFEEIIVSRPLHLRAIAAATDVSYAELRRLNPELRRDVTPPDDSAYHLKVPVGSAAAVEEALASVETWKAPRVIATPKRDRGERRGWYRVRMGDSLSTIAKRFRVTVEELKLRNNLSGSLIKAGDLLHIGR